MNTPITSEQAKACALHFMKPWIDDGWPVEEIMEGHPGRGGKHYWLQIGGIIIDHKKELPDHMVCVYKVHNTDCFFTFSIHDLIKEIKAPAQQMSLF